ncbi:conserved hypothetical protein [Formosa agariphila KMM 3901]|uniref:Uncharacterized protein n=1 Tax=Formosa agariphila (strain DSM 15362 / KCTC 12365 / LMG 23005 / KMM 3901 / M-2Alg 35-1) TaxID=1347342 RepID=T2KP38_FORAG|nr:hypothetical protein [Formosa agariphila]CDF79744.1 conserved hypothetical protein [Formosa agariphila KMM 3901]
MKKLHSFHIPVMGIGFTADTPLKVSHLGIDSAISLVDDILLEKLRKMYCNMFELPYDEIDNSQSDFRAKRITSYLDMIHDVTEEKFNQLKEVNKSYTAELKQYLNLLPSTSEMKFQFLNAISGTLNLDKAKKFLTDNLVKGSIDVNIMTKVDKDNFKDKKKLPIEYNDAHAALRGYANSNLSSSLILSAGMNPSLFSYLENFMDFYPDATGYIKKKVILKVSDYRSALIQGKILAKKGIWISEFRIESGLNCGGHAFATNGLLLGPILNEFTTNRESLINELHDLLTKALKAKGYFVPKSPLPIQITAQGGVGTSEEHDFLLHKYKLDSVGWGTPFLLVPEATTVDDATLKQLTKAKEEDLYLSNISPLGVPFNSMRGNTKDAEKDRNIEKNRPGSACPKKFVALNKEFSEEGLCTASRQYQHLKIKKLDELSLDKIAYKKELDKITVKSCTCVGLGTSALLKYNLDTKTEGTGVSVCPGPNMAYFSKILSLKEMSSHIYGEIKNIVAPRRPNIFVKELTIYVDYITDKFNESPIISNKREEKYFTTFINNLKSGVLYYESMLEDTKDYFETSKNTIYKSLNFELDRLKALHDKVSLAIQVVS